MNFIIFFIYVPLVHSELHILITTYLNRRTIAGIPEISSVTTLNGRHIDYYDSEIKKLIPRQDWMEFASTDRWKEYTEIRERVQQTNKINITVLMEQFNHSYGVHMYQRIYGCDWNDETGVSVGFDRHGYDGVNIITLDLKRGRYTASVPQADLTVQKWNNDRKQLEFLKGYYKYQCSYWLTRLATFNKRGKELLGQSLTGPIQKNLTKSSKFASDDSFICHPAFIILVIFLVFILLIALYYRKEFKPWKKETYYRAYISNPDKSASPPDNLSEQRLMVPSE